MYFFECHIAPEVRAEEFAKATDCVAFNTMITIEDNGPNYWRNPCSGTDNALKRAFGMSTTTLADVRDGGLTGTEDLGHFLLMLTGEDSFVKYSLFRDEEGWVGETRKSLLLVCADDDYHSIQYLTLNEYNVLPKELPECLHELTLTGCNIDFEDSEMLPPIPCHVEAIIIDDVKVEDPSSWEAVRDALREADVL